MEPVTTTTESVSFITQFATFMHEGGPFMWIIFFGWLLGIAVAVERFIFYRRVDVDGAGLMNEIKKHVLENNVGQAVAVCSNTKAVLPHVLKSALKRANQPKEKIQDALSSSILEIVPSIEKRLGHLALIANISTLFGLLGTIQGLIQSFSAVAGADPAEKAKLLAVGISTAMNTTALGLISAISIMIVHAFLVTRSEKIMSEVDEHSMKLLDLLGTKKDHRPHNIVGMERAA